MSIRIYFCDWTKSFVAYDTDYEDEYTPHGRGLTEEEAIEDLKDTMECYLGYSPRFNEWMLGLSGKEIKHD